MSSNPSSALQDELDLDTVDAEEADPLPVKRDLETQAYAGAAMRYHNCTTYTVTSMLPTAAP